MRVHSPLVLVFVTSVLGRSSLCPASPIHSSTGGPQGWMSPPSQNLSVVESVTSLKMIIANAFQRPSASNACVYWQTLKKGQSSLGDE